MPDNEHKQVYVPKGKFMINPMIISRKFEYLFKDTFAGNRQYL